MLEFSFASAYICATKKRIIHILFFYVNSDMTINYSISAWWWRSSLRDECEILYA